MGGDGDHERRVIISYSTYYKAVFGVLAVWWFIWLLLVGTVVENIGSEGTRQRSLLRSAAPYSGGGDLKKVEVVTGGENGRKVEVIGAEKILHHPELDLNYMSKRKVPNGPDPIHNRKTRNSGRPPGQA